MARYDVLVSNWMPYPETRRTWRPETEAAFLDLVLGHDAAAMGAGFGTLLLRSAEWAATGQVTLPPPALWPSTPAAMTAAAIDLNATFSAVARYRYGDERKPLHALQQLVLYAHSLAGNDPQGVRGTLADRMATLLTSPDATPAAKSFVCGQLAEIATEKQAAAVNGLLAHQQPVADALGRIGGDALARALQRTPRPARPRDSAKCGPRS